MRRQPKPSHNGAQLGEWRKKPEKSNRGKQAAIARWPMTSHWCTTTLSLLCLLAVHSIEPNAFAESVHANPAHLLIMQVSLHHLTSDKYVLHVKIINEQSVSVSILNTELPWYTPNEFVLIPRGIRLDVEKSLMARYGPTSDYMHLTYTLAQGEFLEGDITLHNMFRILLSDVEKFGVIIEWSCKAKHLNLTCKEGAGGAFTIPKGGGPSEVGTH